ncbi:uncharacterized protein LOC135468770 [Liolophura sinensis]|uniref:uncharacterized protein LOC135468770 n=1 Tax=Liolophura sinensis TaxID=3198878 RepID=UPI0031587E68
MAGSNLMLPKMADGFLGPQAKFEAYGLRTMSHPEPVIVLPGNEVEVKMERTQPMKMMAKLVPYGIPKECVNHVLMSVDESGTIVSFKVTIPGTGWFKLNIFALPPSEAGPKLLGVYNYLINVENISIEGYPFPKQHAQWRDDGCYVWEPLILHAGFRVPGVHFKYRLPNAAKAAIRIGNTNDWIMLEPGSERDVWEGSGDLNGNYAKDTKVKLNVNYGGANWNTLLEYTI